MGFQSATNSMTNTGYCTSGVLEEALHSTHLFHHLSKLGVLGEELLNLPHTGARPPGHTHCTARLLAKQLRPLGMIQLCESG